MVNAVGRGANVCGMCAGREGCWGADVVEKRRRRRLRSMKRGHASRTTGTATRNLRSLLIHPTLLHLLLTRYGSPRLRSEFNYGSVTSTIYFYTKTNQRKLICMRAVKRSPKCDERVKRLYCEELSLRPVPLPKALALSILSHLTD